MHSSGVHARIQKLCQRGSNLDNVSFFSFFSLDFQNTTKMVFRWRADDGRPTLNSGLVAL